MFPLRDNIPTNRLPVVTLLVVAINVVVYLLTLRGGIFGGPSNPTVVDLGAIPYELTHPGEHCELLADSGGIACEGMAGVTGSADPQPPTIVTVFSSMFMHGGVLHIAGNMLFLWIFGNNVEDRLGRIRFVAFYLLGGIAALALQTVIAPDATNPTIGASGAVAGVLGGYLLLYPRARVLTFVLIVFFFTIIEIPAFLFLFIWIGQQILFGSLDLLQPVTQEGGGVAYFAHIGGFAFGLLAIRAFARRDRDDGRGGLRPRARAAMR